MLEGWVVVAIALGYIGLLFVIASYGDRFRQLVYRVVVGFCQHGRFLLLVFASMAPAIEQGNAKNASFL